MGRRKGKGRKKRAGYNPRKNQQAATAERHDNRQDDNPGNAQPQQAMQAATPQPGNEGQSLAQQRARHALAFVQARQRSQQGEDNDYGNFVSYVKALPALIIMSGLGQALAMEKAGAAKSGKIGAGHQQLYTCLDHWLRGRGPGPEGQNGEGWPTSPYADDDDVLEAITRHGEAAYIRAQAEAMAYLEWLKKFAMALLKDVEAEAEAEAQAREAAADGE